MIQANKALRWARILRMLWPQAQSTAKTASPKVPFSGLRDERRGRPAKTEAPITCTADRQTRDVENYTPAHLGKFDPAFTDVTVMHFGALRGSNAAKDCGVIFITGRNMPPPPEVDLKARALFWDADEPLQHDEAGRLTAKEDRSSLLPTQLRGYIQSARNTRDQSGVRVPAFSDARIDALFAQYRDAETMQALGRLRLVHAAYPKRVIFLSNLPVEMPVDQLVSFDELMPDRLEIELLKRGNIPITDLGLQKMRPDLAPNRGQAVNLLSRSSLCNPRKAMESLPVLWQTMMVVATFRAGTMRKTKHQHLFVGKDMVSDGIAMAGRVPNLEDVTRLLVHGDPQMGGTGWGEIDDLRIDFLHSSSTT